MMKNILNIARRRKDVDRDQLRDAYRAAFSSPAGRMVLEDICSCLSNVHWPDDTRGNADRRAFMDGQRAAALRILAMLEDERP